MSIPSNLGQGFRPYLLQHIRSVVGDPQTPQYKLDYHGFLNMMKSQSMQPDILRLNNSAGHRESVQVRYKQRYTKDFTGTSEADVCDVTNIEARREQTVDINSFRFIVVSLEDETVARYEDEASKSVSLGLPPTAIMNELLEEIYRAANALLDGINEDLQTLAVAAVGNNRRTGNNAAAQINLNKAGTVNNLTDGLTQIMSDYMINLGSGTPQVWGSGLMNNFMLQLASTGMNQSGFNPAIQAAGMKWYFDQTSAGVLGANQIIVAQPNTVQWVEYLQYTGFKGGVKPGSSIFGTFTLPMFLNETQIAPIGFDFQLKYNDCATSMTDQYYGTTFTMQKGWSLIISKKSGLYTLPNDAYRGTDTMSGNRGTLRYEITNTCDNC